MQKAVKEMLVIWRRTSVTTTKPKEVFSYKEPTVTPGDVDDGKKYVVATTTITGGADS